MTQYEYRPDYRRHLPHYQPRGTILFVTFRLAGSIPVEVIRRLKAEDEARELRLIQTVEGPEQHRLLYEERKRQFGRFDAVLDRAGNGPYWLREARIAAIVDEALRYRDGDVYDLDVFCIMPNHVHAVYAPRPKDGDDYHALQAILHSLKRHTARQANKVLGREGAFWQHESYDHVVRNPDEWGRIVSYVIHNPVKAGLVDRWENWPWTYARWRESRELGDLANRGTGELRDLANRATGEAE
jgi:putative transposase